MDKFTDNEIAFIIQKKEQTDLTWVEITKKYNKKFRKDRDFECIKKCYQRYKNFFNEDDNHIRTLKTIHRTKKANSYTAKENRTILQHWNDKDDLLESIEGIVQKISLTQHKIPKAPKKSSKKKNMTLELLFSDVHYGKLINTIDNNFVNNEEIRKRVKKIADTVIKEIARESKSFNVERLVLAMIGDMIENADFHGVESHKGSEFGTSRQVQECIFSIFTDLLVPIAHTGVQIDIPCITGNHDRVGKEKTYQKTGEENLTYIIYKTLELLCQTSGLKNVKFDIPSGIFISVDIYGNTIVYEHGDELKNLNRDTMATLMSKRQAQLGRVVHYYRVGHFHEDITYNRGKMMVNGSIPGMDDYAHSKGFCSSAIQILNYYVETNKRKTCFFRSFPICLNPQDT